MDEFIENYHPKRIRPVWCKAIVMLFAMISLWIIVQTVGVVSV